MYCQYYSGPLESFTSAKKAVIVKIYLVITILKLKPYNNFNLRSYRGICNNFIFLPQNPWSLLNLLPLKTTFFNNVVRVVWVDKTLSQYEQLSRFVNIRKHCVILALHWLMINNLLHENIEINQHLHKIWEDEFISFGIINSMIYWNFY